MSRLHTMFCALIALAALAFPGAALAQEAEEPDPPVLRLSFFMCNLSGDNGDAIEQEMERDLPVWNALVDEGMIESYGYFFHWWADEWNVGIYTIAPTIQAIVDASAEADDRLTALNGENAPSAMGDYCPHHRDGFYTMGPSTDMDEAETAAGGR
ncbi:MAG TPA: hypothetical protein VFM44_04895 [Gemmatimonadota bacterium]|nr:hypothetical protein [Gemmatimonadota bacterium]